MRRFAAVSAVETRSQNRPRPRRPPSARPTREQVAWIDVRDRIGEALDEYLGTGPSPEMRAAIEAVEDGLRFGDHAVGLL